MPVDTGKLQQILCESLCSDVQLVCRPDGALMLRTGFEFPDGDRFPFHVLKMTDGSVRLSDQGHTLMHISYDHDIDVFLQGNRAQLLESIVSESSISMEGGVFYIDSPIERLPEAIFQFGQALTRVYDLVFLSRPWVKSSFYDDLSSLLINEINEEKVQIDYVPKELPNPEAYWVDFKIETRFNHPTFLYGIPDRNKARFTAIMLSYFRRHRIEFESILVFEDQSDIPRNELAYLSEIGGRMIPSLDAFRYLIDDLLGRVTI